MSDTDTIYVERGSAPLADGRIDGGVHRPFACPACSGKGYVHGDYAPSSRCVACDGTGRNPELEWYPLGTDTRKGNVWVERWVAIGIREVTE